MAAAHLLNTAVPWQAMLAAVGSRYFNTLNSCAKFFTQQDYATDMIMLQGQGKISGSAPFIVEGNLVAGHATLLHVLDEVLMPTHPYGTPGSCPVPKPWQPPASSPR